MNSLFVVYIKLIPNVCATNTRRYYRFIESYQISEKPVCNLLPVHFVSVAKLDISMHLSQLVHTLINIA